MNTPHAPKVMALEAYSRRRLSVAGQARLEQHLHTCGLCRQALDNIVRYEALRVEAQEAPTPELDWERLERALDQTPAPTSSPRFPGRGHEKRPAISGKVIALAWPVLALAATFALAFMALSERRLPVAQPSVSPPAPAVEEARIQGWITLVAATAEVESGGVRRAAVPGERVQEGTRIVTAKDSELHVAVEGGGGLIVEAQSELSIKRLREHSIELALESGELFQQVRKLNEHERYEVTFGPYLASVRGTRFRVMQREAQASVVVYEGRVVVHQGEQLIADLSAGESWRSVPEAEGPVARDRQVHASDPASQNWPTLTLPALANVAAWRIENTSLAAQTALAMRMPAGDVVLHYEDLRGRERALSLKVAAEGTSLSEAAIRELIAAQNDPRGQLDPEQIAPVVRAGLDPLRRCYERGLKRDPSLVGKLVLSIRVAPDGHVARATLEGTGGPKLPLDVESCMQMEARGWLFPKPTGGAVVFEVPLHLRSGH